jgi:hypothetical protein
MCDGALQNPIGRLIIGIQHAFTSLLRLVTRKCNEQLHFRQWSRQAGGMFSGVAPGFSSSSARETPGLGPQRTPVLLSFQSSCRRRRRQGSGEREGGCGGGPRRQLGDNRDTRPSSPSQLPSFSPVPGEAFVNTGQPVRGHPMEWLAAAGVYGRRKGTDYLPACVEAIASSSSAWRPLRLTTYVPNCPGVARSTSRQVGHEDAFDLPELAGESQDVRCVPDKSSRRLVVQTIADDG